MSSKYQDARGSWRGAILGSAAALAVLIAACTTTPPAPVPVPVAPAVPVTPPDAPATPLAQPQSRWIPVAFDDLPGWTNDRSSELWPALVRSCERASPAWVALCADAAANPPQGDAAVRAWLEQRLRPYRLESHDGRAEGLITGYFEPLIAARRQADATHRVALHMPPTDLATRRPYWTREQLDSLPAAQRGLRGREIAYVSDPLDALVLQIQGSGRLDITEPDGSRRLVRAAFAGHNDRPYKSVGRWLIEQGELRADQASWPGIKAWARRNGRRLNEMLWSNPRVVFFREEPLPDPALGPRGAQGVPLTPGRSIAVDPQSVPYGTPVWLDTTEPLSSTPLRRLVMAQDTGSAIVGAVRADYFWGWGEEAAEQAGRMKQPLRLWVLWPRR